MRFNPIGFTANFINITLFETGQHPTTAFAISLFYKIPTPASCLSPPEQQNVHPSDDTCPVPIHLTSLTPTTSSSILLTSFFRFSDFPTGYRVLTFQVATLLFLSILTIAAVALRLPAPALHAPVSRQQSHADGQTPPARHECSDRARQHLRQSQPYIILGQDGPIHNDSYSTKKKIIILNIIAELTSFSI